MDSSSNAHEHVFELSSGALCLDFVNTLGDRPICHNEYLHEYSDLIRWCRQAGVVDETLERTLSQRTLSEPEQAGLVLEEALDLRELLFKVFAGLAAGDTIRKDQLSELNSRLQQTLPHLRIGVSQGTFQWEWQGLHQSLDSVLWPVVRSAAELLISDESSLVRQCASETCSWLFVDRSRNHRRRWCDMQTCGNRAKARRHYRRKKQRKG